MGKRGERLEDLFELRRVRATVVVDGRGHSDKHELWSFHLRHRVHHVDPVASLVEGSSESRLEEWHRPAREAIAALRVTLDERDGVPE